MSKIRVMVVLVGLTLATATHAAFVDQWSVPWFDNTNGNPYTDGAGNQWGAYQASWNDSTTWSNYTLLGWNNGSWGDNNPMYWSSPALKGANGNSGTGALVFTPGQNGTYSFYGTMNFWNSADSWATVWIQMVKFTGSTGAVLAGGSFHNADTLYLSSVAELQDIPMTTGDKLALVMTCTSGVYGNAILNNTGIGFVPEPATLGLLVFGGSGLVWKKK